MGLFNKEVVVSFPLIDGPSIDADSKKKTVSVTAGDGSSKVFKRIQPKDQDPFEEAVAEARNLIALPEVAGQYLEAESEIELRAAATDERSDKIWPKAQIVGRHLTSKASKAIDRQCIGNNGGDVVNLVIPGADFSDLADRQLSLGVK